ncbi:glycosyltransferase family 2 protein [Nocardioides acrostichi]|uniref:Glycosyltransferase family 2 protein n=1 Tax=Nocardioides acrostichi TaxID=2784339 RepID=A0A930YB35_9ACTN|nr:glycosyltransferase family 2 protein [Nocardioides acrostichi]MBF4162038.1 glycosyltransferase family 2 protein [Nocardioides acrostichi]
MTAHRRSDSAYRHKAVRPSDPRISIVVPTLNEARNLEVVLPELPHAHPGVHEIIVVDGGSVDDTVETARRILPEARILTQARRGKGNAMATGFAEVTGDIVVMFDADGSADPAEIPSFVKALTDGADFAKGSRFCVGGGSADITLIRGTGNKFLNTVMNKSFGTAFSDLCYGYNAFWADMLHVLDLPEHTGSGPADGAMLWGDGFEIETVIACRFAASQGLIAEVPSVERERIFGDSNLHAVSDGFRVLRTVRTEWQRARDGLAVLARSAETRVNPTADNVVRIAS